MQKKTTLRPSPTALLNPRCDASFKAMFTQETEESNAALQDFISTLLGKQVMEFRLIQNEPSVDMITEMQMSFDVSVVFDDGERADLEMQSRREDYDYSVRAETQVARLLNVSVRKGSNWSVPKAYQISVLDFHFDKDDKSALEWYSMRKDGGGRLGDRLNVIFFDLVKIRRLLGTPPEQLTKLEKWGLFLSYADDATKKEYVDSLIRSEEGIMRARNALLEVSQDDINWATQNTIFKSIRDNNSRLEAAERRGEARGEKRGEKRGLERGLAEGAHNQAIETARRMLTEGFTHEQTARLTGLSPEDVHQLQ